MAALMQDMAQLEEEDTTKSKSVYLVTLAHPQAEKSSDGIPLKALGDTA